MSVCCVQIFDVKAYFLFCCPWNC